MAKIWRTIALGSLFHLMLLLEPSPEESGLFSVYSYWAVGFTTKGSCFDS